MRREAAGSRVYNVPPPSVLLLLVLLFIIISVSDGRRETYMRLYFMNMLHTCQSLDLKIF